jgi:uncharacterized protein (TIGR03437 family)
MGSSNCCVLALFAASTVVAPTHLRGEIRISAVVTAAGYVPGLPAPGSLGVIFCSGLTGIQGVVVAPDDLAGVTVHVGSRPAPILAAADLPGYQQINFQVPWEAGSSVVAVAQGEERAVYQAPNPAQWSIFLPDPDGYITARHSATGVPVMRDNPARSGELITAYTTNLGPVLNPPPTGVPTPSGQTYPLDNSRENYYLHWVGDGAGGPVQTIFMGLAPDLIGVYQIIFRTPDAGVMSEISLFAQRFRFCGFFFDPVCGRGVVIAQSAPGRLPVAP